MPQVFGAGISSWVKTAGIIVAMCGEAGRDLGNVDADPARLLQNGAVKECVGDVVGLFGVLAVLDGLHAGVHAHFNAQHHHFGQAQEGFALVLEAQFGVGRLPVLPGGLTVAGQHGAQLAQRGEKIGQRGGFGVWQARQGAGVRALEKARRLGADFAHELEGGLRRRRGFGGAGLDGDVVVEGDEADEEGLESGAVGHTSISLSRFAPVSRGDG